jgi:hypothetical protein
LSQACDPATFGIDKKDVLDESYRKAGKIDAAKFATKFNIERTGLVELIRSELLEGEGARKGINVELYKLNVYGELSTFHAHFYCHSRLFHLQEKTRSSSLTKIPLVVLICSDH